MTATTSIFTPISEAQNADAHRAHSLTQREWARTGEHGWTEDARLSSCPGWWVLPGMVLQTKFSRRIAELGLGDVRVVGAAQQAAGRYAPWTLLVESIETGERTTVTGSSYDSHEWHVSAPSYMLSSHAFHAVKAGALSYSHERFGLI